MIEIQYHDEAADVSCPSGQAGGFENADGNGEIHFYPLLDDEDHTIGYKFVRVGKMLEDIRHGVDAKEAYDAMYK